MEMMNPILVDDGVAGEGMEANTLFMEPMGAEFRSAAFSSACRASLGASRRSARAASAAVFASSSSCSTPQSSAKLKDRAAASDPTHHERTPMRNADILSIQLYTLRSLAWPMGFRIWAASSSGKMPEGCESAKKSGVGVSQAEVRLRPNPSSD